MLIVPVLVFNGNCLKALELYAKAFDGTIGNVIFFKDLLYTEKDLTIPKEKENDVFYSVLYFGEKKIVLKDILNEEPINGSLRIICDSKEAVIKAYDILKDGSKTLIPIGSKPYSPCAVSFIDQFGIRFEILFER